MTEANMQKATDMMVKDAMDADAEIPALIQRAVDAGTTCGCAGAKCAACDALVQLGASVVVRARVETGEITPVNALVVIATEMRAIRRALEDLTYDPDGNGTTLGRLEVTLHDSLRTFGTQGEETVAGHIRDIARSLP